MKRAKSLEKMTATCFTVQNIDRPSTDHPHSSTDALGSLEAPFSRFCDITPSVFPAVYNMIFQGYPSYNDWLLGVDKKGTPGNIQSVLLFGKNPGFEPRTMGFPTRVLLNGYECAMPQFAPTSAGHRPWVSVTVAVLAGLATVALCI